MQNKRARRYFNTSHVSIKQHKELWHGVRKPDFNTSHVSIKRLHIPQCHLRHPYFNTSHVSIKLSSCPPQVGQYYISIHPMFLLNWQFRCTGVQSSAISIHPMFLLNLSSACVRATIVPISIHPMFLLNYTVFTLSPMYCTFQYIPCFY